MQLKSDDLFLYLATVRTFFFEKYNIQEMCNDETYAWY